MTVSEHLRLQGICVYPYLHTLTHPFPKAKPDIDLSLGTWIPNELQKKLISVIEAFGFIDRCKTRLHNFVVRGNSKDSASSLIRKTGMLHELRTEFGPHHFFFIFKHPVLDQITLLAWLPALYQQAIFQKISCSCRISFCSQIPEKWSFKLSVLKSSLNSDPQSFSWFWEIHKQSNLPSSHGRYGLRKSSLIPRSNLDY